MSKENKKVAEEAKATTKKDKAVNANAFVQKKLAVLNAKNTADSMRASIRVVNNNRGGKN